MLLFRTKELRVNRSFLRFKAKGVNMILNAYKNIFSFLKRHKFTVLTAFLTYAAIVVLYSFIHTNTANDYLTSELISQYELSKSEFLSTINSEFLFKLYFNLKSCFVGILAGFMPLFFLPVFEFVFLGNLFVLCFGFAVSSNALVFSQYITDLLPHSVFEFLFFAFSFALSLILSKEVSKLIIYYSPFRENFVDRFKNGLKPKFKPLFRNIAYSFTFVIVPLVIISTLLFTFCSSFAI